MEARSFEGSLERDASPAQDTIPCPGCLTLHRAATLAPRQMVCPGCGYHHQLTIEQRLAMLLDPGTFTEWDAALAVPLSASADALPLVERNHLRRMRAMEQDCLRTGQGALLGHPVAVGVFDVASPAAAASPFVAERLDRLFGQAREAQLPLVMVTASAVGDREVGLPALTQMAKVTVSVDRFRDARSPFVAVMADPTLGGVPSRLAALADVVVAEPGARIGLPGPRAHAHMPRPSVAELPAERLLADGQIDAVVARPEMREWLDALFGALCPPRIRFD